MTEVILLERERGLLTLRLNRPDKKNALTRAMYSHLAEALKQADTDPEINAVLITGSAECFTAGNDIADFIQQPPSNLDSPVFHFMLNLLECRKPVIAARVGGIPEILGTNNAALARPDDAQSLADVMTAAMTQKGWAVKVMPDADAFKQAFATSTMSASMMRLYRQLVPEKATGRETSPKYP